MHRKYIVKYAAIKNMMNFMCDYEMLSNPVRVHR